MNLLHLKSRQAIDQINESLEDGYQVIIFYGSNSTLHAILETLQSDYKFKWPSGHRPRDWVPRTNDYIHIIRHTLYTGITPLEILEQVSGRRFFRGVL